MNVKFSVEMPEELYEVLSACAKKTGYTKSQWLRMAIEALALFTKFPESQILMETKKGEVSHVFIPGVTK